jgi:hypothetical protein
MSNILESKTHKISDRRQILLRVLGALLLDPACRYFFRGEWKPLSADEQANWEARTFIQECLEDFPSVPPSALPVDLPLEPLSAQDETGSPEGNVGHTPDEVGQS